MQIFPLFFEGKKISLMSCKELAPKRSEVYRADKLALNKEVNACKQTCFDHFCQEANTNLWGDAYERLVPM